MASHQFFLNQSKRLLASYGKNKYPQDRLELIWEVVRYISDSDLKKMIDDFIADSERPPMREAFVRVIRERKYIQQNQECKKDAQEFKTNLSSDQITRSIGYMLKNVGNAEKMKEFDSALGDIIKTKCRKCNDSGIIYVKEKDHGQQFIYSNFMFKCDCVEGRKNTDNYPAWDEIQARNYESM